MFAAIAASVPIAIYFKGSAYLGGMLLDLLVLGPFLYLWLHRSSEKQ